MRARRSKFVCDPTPRRFARRPPRAACNQQPRTACRHPVATYRKLNALALLITAFTVCAPENYRATPVHNNESRSNQRQQG